MLYLSHLLHFLVTIHFDWLRGSSVCITIWLSSWGGVEGCCSNFLHRWVKFCK
jgi:hypothetical protein